MEVISQSDEELAAHQLVNRSYHSFPYCLVLLLLFRLTKRSLAFLNTSIYHSSEQRTADAEPNWTNGRITGHKAEAEKL